MGMFDTFVDGEKEAQVKCFDCTLQTWAVGDEVPELCGEKTYAIFTREGFYAVVQDGLFKGLTESSPIQMQTALVPVFDKYGNRYSQEESKGEFDGWNGMNDPYLYKKD